ncbi:MAG: EAL domain-containing protein [Gammaproteobacteria bacterium]|nr:EAL domain-containing protein [Gammaproteobacteria bacterium]
MTRLLGNMLIAVNISANQFRHPDFVSDVLEVLQQTGARPDRLKLELTESFIIADIEDAIEKMAALKKQGIALSLDDFGTGYSSLSYLKRLPIDELKIDKSFVNNILIDDNDAAIARTIIALGKTLGLSVVAEGVETEEQLQFLFAEGCDLYQGSVFIKRLI